MPDPDNPPEDHIRITCFQRFLPVMDSYHPICFTKTTGSNDADGVSPKESVHRAINENPRNASLTLPPASSASVGHVALALMTRKFWRPGRELRIGFQGGSTWQKVRRTTLQLH